MCVFSHRPWCYCRAFVILLIFLQLFSYEKVLEALHKSFNGVQGMGSCWVWYCSHSTTSLEMNNKRFPSNHSDNSLQHMQRELPTDGLASNCVTSLEMINKCFPSNHSDNSLQRAERTT